MRFRSHPYKRKQRADVAFPSYRFPLFLEMKQRKQLIKIFGKEEILLIIIILYLPNLDDGSKDVIEVLPELDFP
jgi:hypothetical protein